MQAQISGASFIKVAALKRFRKRGGNVHMHLSLPTLGFIEKFYAEKGLHSHASFHPRLDLTQSFTDTGSGDTDGEITK